jgi:non-ribosomal peptide synthetase component F
MFVNTVLLRVDTSSDPAFCELAGQVAGATLEALEHAAVPLQHVVEDLVSRRDPAVTPLYQIGFNHLPGVPLNSCYGSARDELALELSGHQGRVEYRTSLFDEASARAIAVRYLRVLDAVTDRPDLRVSRVPLLDPAERAVLLGFGTAGDPAGEPAELAGLTVPELILAQAARTPDAIAVRACGASLSYRDLVERAWSLAGRLRGQGIGPERLVALALSRSPELVVAILAVLVAGGGYLPLDPAWPAERLAFMLADSGAAVLLTPADIAGPDSPGAADRARVLSAGPANVAYVIYTSDSTGRPKGSAIEHRSLANYVRWFIRRFGLGPADRVLASTSPSFDAFGIELFPALVAGGTVVVAPESAGPDPDALLGLAATENVTMIATADGVLVLNGRADSQIKIRGLRVEPAEIEMVLREQPGVRDAAVVAREEAAGDRRLVAYVLAGPEAGPSTMRAALRRSLPEYMVPAALVPLRSFPLTSHGKLDVTALPAPDYAAAACDSYLAPRTACERLIATIWTDVLGVDRVGAGDDFFDLGGHSLLAARIAVRLSDIIGSEVPVHLFFSHVTVSELARAIEELMADEISALSEDEAYRMLHGTVT